MIHMEFLPSLNVILLMSHPGRRPKEICRVPFSSTSNSSASQMLVFPQHNDIADFFQISTWKKKRHLFTASSAGCEVRCPIFEPDYYCQVTKNVENSKGSKELKVLSLPAESSHWKDKQQKILTLIDFANFNENISCPWESIQQRMQGKAQDILDGSPIESSSKSEISVPTWSKWATKDIPVPSIPSG